MTLVVDATVTIASVGSAEDFKALGDDDLVAPALMWSEARSTLHLGLLKGNVSADQAKGPARAPRSLPGPPRR